MTRLRQRLASQIAALGPMSIADYMGQCLFDPTDGYYTTREPFGADGDFTTAPEVSQMFGELVAVFLLSAWRGLGAPSPVTLAEIGPGRGTLMKDMQRVLSRIAPDLAAAVGTALIEVSPRLRAVQAETLAGSPWTPIWHDDVEQLPNRPLLIVGNELFDAIPFRQYVRTDHGWRERMVGLDPDGNLAFQAGAVPLDMAVVPDAARNAPTGAIVEVAPARGAMMARIVAHLATHGGVGLFFDYGYTTPAPGDTLQALRRHRHDDPLAHPGEADLTSHVDFHALSQVVRAGGLAATTITQGDFLLGLGLLERAGRLGANADESVRQRLRGEVERLASPDQMGTLFKAMLVHPPSLRLAPFAAD